MFSRIRKRAALPALAATTLLTVTACAGGEGGDQGATGEPYIIGFTSDFSSNFGYLGLGLRSGLDAYWDSLNEAGGIDGHPVEMIAIDDASQPDRGTANVTQLITQDGAIAIAGVMYSAICAAVVPILEQYQVPEICGVVSADLISPVNRWVYGTTTDQASYAAPQVTMARKLIEERGIQNPRVAILYATGSAAIEQWAVAVEEGAKTLGWEVVAIERVPREAVDMSTEISKIIAAGPDVMILGAGNDAWVLAGMNQIKSSGDPFPVVSYDVPSWTTFREIAWEDFYYVSALAYAHEGATEPGLKKFYEDATAAGIDPNGPYVLRGYLQAAILHNAMERCGFPCTGADLQKALDETDFDTGGLISGNAVIDPYDHRPVVNLAAYQWLPGADAPEIAEANLPAGTEITK